MNNNEQAIIKLAQIRMAINHVLRIREMEKQAKDPDWARNLEISNKPNGSVGIPTPQWSKGMGGKVNKSRTIERYNKPENSPTGYFWPFNGPLKETQNKTKRMIQQQQNSKKKP